ncbi:MAG: DNA primase [Cyclobacteriaceae bacterium]|nr:MAG: DNA primase [Cyclobacteriaceae bacterium]
MPISRQTIEEVRSRMDILDVVSDFVTLKRAGQQYKALSPFTNEKTPSFFVVPSKGIFKDFSSGKGGDAITFVMEHEGMSYLEAIRYLAKKYGIEIRQEAGDRPDESAQERDSLYIVMNYAKDYFHNLLLHHEEGQAVGLSYFRERGFTDSTIRKFELGYSLDEWHHFSQQALRSGFSQAMLEKAGLIVKREGKDYDRFRGRVIFPVHNLSGKVIAFGARILKQAADRQQPKYINSPETEIYKKGEVLYGLFQARNEIRRQNFCYLVEGYTDVLSLHQAGIENVVASSGTALTEEQIRLIRRFTDNITVLFDGDEAGVRAALRGIDLLLKSDLNVRVVLLPHGEDPDSFARKNSTSVLRQYLSEHAHDFISFKVNLYKDSARNDPLQKAEAIREIVTSIAGIPDPVKRSVYIRETARLLDVPENVLLIELNKLLIQERRRKQQQAAEPQVEPVASVVAGQPLMYADAAAIQQLQERETIRLLLNYAEKLYEDEDGSHNVRDTILQEIEDIEFTHPVCREIIGLYRKAAANNESLNSFYLLDNGSEEVKKLVAELLTNRYSISTHWRDKYHIFITHESEELQDITVRNVLRLKFWLLQQLIEDNLAQWKKSEEEQPGNTSEWEIFIVRHEQYKQAQREIADLLGIVVQR